MCRSSLGCRRTSGGRIAPGDEMQESLKISTDSQATCLAAGGRAATARGNGTGRHVQGGRSGSATGEFGKEVAADHALGESRPGEAGGRAIKAVWFLPGCSGRSCPVGEASA